MDGILNCIPLSTNVEFFDLINQDRDVRSRFVIHKIIQTRVTKSRWRRVKYPTRF